MICRNGSDRMLSPARLNLADCLMNRYSELGHWQSMEMGKGFEIFLCHHIVLIFLDSIPCLPKHIKTLLPIHIQSIQQPAHSKFSFCFTNSGFASDHSFSLSLQSAQILQSKNARLSQHRCHYGIWTSDHSYGRSFRGCSRCQRGGARRQTAAHHCL